MGLKAIFHEGMKERRRRKSLRGGKNQLKDKQGQYAGLLTALGRKAWESHVAIDAFGEIKTSLAEAAKMLEQLQERKAELGRQAQQAADDKKKELDRLAAGHKELEESKRKVDGALSEQKNAQQSAQKDAEQARARLAAIGREREQLTGKAADPTVADAQKNQDAARLADLAKEAQGIEAQAGERDAAARGVDARIAPLQEEAGRLQKRIDDLKAEQKKIASDADKKISSLAGELSQVEGKLKEAEKTQAGNFNRLGESLAASQSKEPEIAKEIAGVQSAKAEMEGIQSLLGGLERQKDEGQVRAYRKMMALLIGGAILVAAILALLIFLLAPKKQATPLGGFSGPIGASVKGLEAIAQQMQEAANGGNADAEELPAQRITVASESDLKSVLPVVTGWQLQTPTYSQGKFQKLETAALQAGYAAEDGRSVQVQITDAGSASALLAPLKLVFSLNLAIDDKDVIQRVSTSNGMPVAERLNKNDQEATLGIIYKDRFLIELKTNAAKGLELLRQFAARLDLSKLLP